MPMRIDCGDFELRPWQEGDQPHLVRHANDREIWRNLRDQFPHPYRAADADRWVRQAARQQPVTDFAIVIDGYPGGGIGVKLRADVERCSAEIGYWLGQTFWGRGIMASAVRAVTRYAMPTLQLTRLYAVSFAYNVRSHRVLEKAGYSHEGTLRRSAIKDGIVVDQRMYGITDLDLESAGLP